MGRKDSGGSGHSPEKKIRMPAVAMMTMSRKTC